MSRRRGRPARHYRLRVRTERRDPIDYVALARAALEQAAMNQSGEEAGASSAPSSPQPTPDRRPPTAPYLHAEGVPS
jgi:predicted ArsR family transcriptional regulator